jgi:putative sterol carrier protein
LSAQLFSCNESSNNGGIGFQPMNRERTRAGCLCYATRQAILGYGNDPDRKQHMKTTARFYLTMATLAAVCCVQPLGAAEGEPANATPQDVFDGMRKSFRAEKAKGVHARYQWELSGPNGSEWWIEVNDGKFKMGRGKIDNPNVTFVSSDKDWVAISNGTLSGKWAYFTGRLKIRGDKGLARKLDEIFP